MTTKKTSLSISRVTLNVHDIARLTDFYATAIGLNVLTADHAAATLGVGSTAMLELHGDAKLPRRSPRDAGLFHTAFLLPSRVDLGRWLVHARKMRLRLAGAADHRVSEALYMADPEGNGIEIYADRPRAAWSYTHDGRVVMDNLALDFDSLHVEDGNQQHRWNIPKGTTIGHVHLQVGEMEPAEQFYCNVLGLNLTGRYRGARFFASGDYHHHFAANIWNSLGAVARRESTTGLAGIQMVASDRDTIENIRKRAVAAGATAHRAHDDLALSDPSGVRFSISLAPSSDFATESLPSALSYPRNTDCQRVPISPSTADTIKGNSP